MKFALGYPTGVPLGGMGTGMIELRSDGRIGTVGCNNNWSAPFTETPGCFFAVGMKNFEGKEEIRLLRDGDEGAWKGMDRIRFRAEYPFAKVVYACCNPVFETELTAFCPNIPHENEDSSIPGARFEFVFRNSERKPLSLRLYLSWEHLSGCGALPDRTWRCDRTGNRIVPVSEEKWEGLVFLPGEGEKELPNAVGEYALFAEKQEKAKLSLHWWNVLEGQEGFLKAIGEGFPAPTPEGREGNCHPAGVLDFEISLDPGERLVLPVALSWYMPNHFAGGAAGMDEEMRAKLAPMHQEEEMEYGAGSERVNYGHFYENRFAGARENMAVIRRFV
nr:GH116 family glycosyl-hydrolase [uncultured Acetatifactor sp.]